MPVIYFFIGTVAELIKMSPVIREFSRREIPFKIIASGQNIISASDLDNLLPGYRFDIVLHDKPIKQSATGLILWFLKTFIKSFFPLRKEFKESDRTKTYMFVHGDTVSTFFGSLVAKLNGMKLLHAEAGLRSFDFFNPFPEEIVRTLVSRLVDVHFCPNEWCVHNLKKRKGMKIDTEHNTLIESVRMALEKRSSNMIEEHLKDKAYFIFVLHRQENLYNSELTSFLIDTVLKLSENMECVFVLHDLTKYHLARLGLLEKIRQNKTIKKLDRLSFVDFIHLLNGSEFIITDGGSNQEETSYLGKPCLLLRKVTERIEGLGENVVISKHQHSLINNFVKEYKQYSRPPIVPQIPPSRIVADFISKQISSISV